MKLDLHNYLQKNLKGLYTHAHKDANNNLLVFPRNTESINRILLNKSFFPNATKKIDLNKVDQSHYIMIMNLSYSLSQSPDYKRDIKKLGIIDIVPPSNDQEMSRHIKCHVNSPEIKLEIFEMKKIILGSHQFSVEPSIVLLQCRNCKQFGHTNTLENKCKNQKTLVLDAVTLTMTKIIAT